MSPIRLARRVFPNAPHTGRLLLAFGLATLAWTLASLASAQIQDRSKLVAALDSAAQAHAADSTVAGISVPVSHQGEMLLHEGYGLSDPEFDVPMAKDAVFEVGSMTKQFTAAAILQFAEKGSIDLGTRSVLFEGGLQFVCDCGASSEKVGGSDSGFSAIHSGMFSRMALGPPHAESPKTSATTPRIPID